MKTWVKVYTKLIDNPDLGALPLEYLGAWTLLLTLAGRLDDRDNQEAETGKLDTAERIAWYLRRSPEEIQPAIDKFMELGLIHTNGDCIYITKYTELQQRPPSSRRSAVRERVQRHRAKGRNDVTSRMERIPDTEEDTDTETETEEDEDKNRELFGVVQELAESNFDRRLSRKEAGILSVLVHDYPELDKQRWEYVFTEAARQNVCKLSYVEGILKNLGTPKPGQSWVETYAQCIQS